MRLKKQAIRPLTCFSTGFSLKFYTTRFNKNNKYKSSKNILLHLINTYPRSLIHTCALESPQYHEIKNNTKAGCWRIIFSHGSVLYNSKYGMATSFNPPSKYNVYELNFRS